MKYSPEYITAVDKACVESKWESQIFEAGYDFAMSQPKHIFDGVAQVGEVRRFEDELVDVVYDKGVCSANCALYDKIDNCDTLTGCGINIVIYKKR